MSLEECEYREGRVACLGRVACVAWVDSKVEKGGSLSRLSSERWLTRESSEGVSGALLDRLVCLAASATLLCSVAGRGCVERGCEENAA